jgi:hypothetical protein
MSEGRPAFPNSEFYPADRAAARKEKGGSPEDARQRKVQMNHIQNKGPLGNIAAMVERGRMAVFTELVDVSPKIAEFLLENNIDNRPIRWTANLRSVETYAAAMQRGEWVINGAQIIVSKDGFLNDGQHRLHAVIKSDCTIRMLITFGVERETRNTVDQGAGRTPGNILSMHGEKNANQLAHATQFLWAYDDKGRMFSYRPSMQQLLDVLSRSDGLRDALKATALLRREFRLSAGYVAGANYVCGRIYPDLTDEFTDAVATGLNVAEQSSPVYRLRRRYQDHVNNSQPLQAVEQAALFIKAFNAFRKHRPLQSLMWRRQGSGAEDFPVVGA